MFERALTSPNNSELPYLSFRQSFKNCILPLLISKVRKMKTNKFDKVSFRLQTQKRSKIMRSLKRKEAFSYLLDGKLYEIKIKLKYLF